VGTDKAFFKDGLIRAVEKPRESQAFVTADSGKRRHPRVLCHRWVNSITAC